MKLKKIVLTVFTLVLLLPVFAGGVKESEIDKRLENTETRSENVRVAALKGPSGIGMAYLFDILPTISSTKYEIEAIASPDVLLPRLLKGELDIGILPPNLAAKVYNANNEELILGAVVGNGMLSLLTRDSSVTSIKNLTGKTVYVAGQGATPEYVFRYLLKNAGLEGTVELDFTIPPAEIASALVSGKIEYAVMPEPFATVAISKDSTIKRALNLQELWASIEGNSKNYPMTVVVIRKEFAKLYPESVRSFLALYKESIEWTTANPVKAGEFSEKYGVGVKAQLASAAIPNAEFVFIDAQSAKKSIEQLLSVFLTYAPTSIGGKLPNSDFYFD